MTGAHDYSRDRLALDILHFTRSIPEPRRKPPRTELLNERSELARSASVIVKAVPLFPLEGLKIEGGEEEEREGSLCSLDSDITLVG